MICNGKKVALAYDLTVDGKLVKSIGTTRPFQYLHGNNEIPAGLEKALRGMKPGDRKRFCLSPKNGFGVENPKSVREIPKSCFPKKDHFIGREVRSAKDGGYVATVKEVRKDTLLLDYNHPYAGKKLEYNVYIVAIEGEGVSA